MLYDFKFSSVGCLIFIKPNKFKEGQGLQPPITNLRYQSNHSKVAQGNPVKCCSRAQQANLSDLSSHFDTRHYPFNAERQAGKL